MKNKLTLLLFFLFIGGFTAAGLGRRPTVFSEKENRYLQTRPALTMESLLSGRYTKEYEAFVTDQFVGRNTWISIKTGAERLLLKQESNGVYFARDGYLIEKQDRDVFESEQAVKNSRILTAFVNDLDDVFGSAHVRLMLVPTAAHILRDKLPPFASPYDQSIYQKNITSGLQSPDISLELTELLSRRREDYIYYKTDHHWTALGAFYAYEAWVRSMGFTPWSPDDFTIEEASTDFYGTIESKVNIPVSPDTLSLYLPKRPASYEVCYNLQPEAFDSLYKEAALLTKDQYAVYLGGNNALVEIKNKLAGNNRRLLVIKDSFAHCFVPFAVNHMAETYMVDLRYFNMPLKQFAEEKQITDVLILYSTANFAADRYTGKLKW